MSKSKRQTEKSFFWVFLTFTTDFFGGNHSMLICLTWLHTLCSVPCYLNFIVTFLVISFTHFSCAMCKVKCLKCKICIHLNYSFESDQRSNCKVGQEFDFCDSFFSSLLRQTFSFRLFLCNKRQFVSSLIYF